jgi:putative glutamine amidotransferase
MTLPLALVTQRVVTDPVTHERRDALDQNWGAFLAACGFLAIPAPNNANRATELWAALQPSALVLTGGNDLMELGGDAPERDKAERALLALALRQRIPVLAICRGMQLLLSHFGVELQSVDGHVAQRHEIEFEGHRRIVNSFHKFAARSAPTELFEAGYDDDGVVEAVRGKRDHVLGLMWHPEREAPFEEADIRLVATALRGLACAA